MISKKALLKDYQDKWDTLVINPKDFKRVENVVKRINKDQLLYHRLETELYVPWFMIAAIHYRESNLNKTRHFANGDPLDADTVNVPKDMMKKAYPYLEPPYDFFDSIMVSFQQQKVPKIENEDIQNILFETERWNGFGYQNKGITSPYLWAGTNHYESGKYVADGKFDPEHVDKQLGCAAIYKLMF